MELKVMPLWLQFQGYKATVPLPIRTLETPTSPAPASTATEAEKPQAGQLPGGTDLATGILAATNTDHAEENKMDPPKLGVIFRPSLIRPRPTTAPVTISSLAEYSSQAQLVEFLITYSEKIFHGSPQPQVAIGSAGALPPQGDHSCPSKPVIIRRKTLRTLQEVTCFSSEEDVHTAERESKMFESTTSFEESEHQQNAVQDEVTMSVSVSGEHSSSATPPKEPYAEPARSTGEASERRSSHSDPLAPARAPRMLQPQHWTPLYKRQTPPAMSGDGGEASFTQQRCLPAQLPLPGVRWRNQLPTWTAPQLVLCSQEGSLQRTQRSTACLT
ncbi:Rho GTPase-activating protein 29 [Sciurus carolinensis]|uniref:Rho GTPase-activating protein 29 n=1 Tax=Sciurus carolinensis TaxID=30640 RepID=A0AA41SWN4_SCICA|nr:Rho GTPase-activating protein 29 [Sciurus carolinensis]